MADGEDDSDIRALDETTVERIAAGEVVERPASVVKELVENSLDAGASRVDVEVEAGGTGGVRVADDGVGMTEADVRLAVRRHTTSKIADIADLEAGVATLGFRGEALHTIGAVSRTTVTTKPRAGDDDGGAAGTELVLEGGEVTHVGPAGRPPGTTVEVEDLFYNTPARRKYLKAEATEFSHVSRVVTRYALANPDVAVSLAHDGREVFATTGRGDLRSTLLSVYGREVAESMVPVEAEGSALAGSPLDAVRGFVSHPETTRSTREYLSTFVNGRYVSEPALREAVLAAYGSQLAADRFPFAVLFVDLPAGAVDVNVHPRKMAVRFGDEAAVREAVETAVRDALLAAGLVRSAAPRGRSAPGDATVEPGGDRGSGRDGEDGADHPAEGTAGADVEAGGADERTAEAGQDSTTADAGTTGSRGAASGGVRDDAARSSGGGVRPSDGATGPAGDTGRDAPGESSGRQSPDAGTTAGDADEQSVERTAWPADPDRKFRAATANARLPGSDDADAGATREYDRLPPLRVLGQAHDTYVVAESPDGLVVVDQHAADERVNYERLTARLAESGTDAQRLVEPVELELTAREAAVFEAAVEELRALGFDATLDGDGRTAVVAAVPAALGDALDPGLLRDVLAESVAGGVDDGRVVESAADALLADLACYPSVTGGTSLSEGSVLDLLAALDDCENPFACPHGRPTVIEVDADELADRFERDYPGHATRRPEE